MLLCLEHERVSRLTTVRLLPPGQDEEGIIVHLLFASSGIERELAEAATPLEVLPGVSVPVATLGHLLAMKLLAMDDVTRRRSVAPYRPQYRPFQNRRALVCTPCRPGPMAVLVSFV